MKRGTAPPLKFCAKRGELLEALNAATSKYAEAANGLSKRMGVLSESEHRLVRDEIETLRLKAERAREIYMSHRAEHGC